MSWLDDTISTISDTTDTIDSALPGDLTIGSIFSNAWSGAKDNVLTQVSNNLANNPNVQAKVKQAAGNKLGNWLIVHWYVPVAMIVLSIGALFLLRKK